MTITAIEKQQKNENRCNLFIDGSYFCSLQLETAVKHRLKSGTEVEETELSELIFESEKSFAFEKAASYLSKKRCSEKEVFDNLLKKGFEEKVCTFAVDKLKSYNYLSDEEYAKSYVRDNLKTCGEKKLRFELKKKGISDKNIEEALKLLSDETALENAYALAQKYTLRKTLDIKTKQSLYRYLLSRGYGYDTVSETVNRIFCKEE